MSKDPCASAARRFFTLPWPRRMVAWRRFREALVEHDAPTALSEAAFLFAHAPPVDFVISPDSPRTWPDPWTILLEGKMCDPARALMTATTVLLSPHPAFTAENTRILRYPDPTTRTGVWTVVGGEHEVLCSTASEAPTGVAPVAVFAQVDGKWREISPGDDDGVIDADWT